jgi:hypothetical protein
MAADANRLAAALDYLERIKRQAVDFGGGVASSLAERARDVGGLAYEAFTSDPNIGRMTTAEFADAAAARAPTPRLDAAGQGAVELGQAVLTQPVQTGKALVQGEVDRARQAITSPRAAGEYAGSMVDPLRLASALRRGPMLELDVYHGSPHRFEEFDASKIGTGEGAQAYGHGIYLAENPEVARGYKKDLSGFDEPFLQFGKTKIAGQQLSDIDLETFKFLEKGKRNAGQFPHNTVYYAKQAAKDNPAVLARLEEMGRDVKFGFEKNRGNFYTADLPDEMVDRMLDWDKPLSEQRELATPILKELGYLRPNDDGPRQFAQAVKALDMEYGGFGESGANGMALFKAIYRGLEQGKPKVIDFAKRMNLGDQAMFMEASPLASEVMKRMGIPGIRYLDAGSRGQGGSGTRNFVVFPGEEKKVKILKRE